MNIEAKNLSKIYGDGENRVVALDHANLEIVSSDFISCALFLDNLRGNTQQSKADSEESELYA